MKYDPETLRKKAKELLGDSNILGNTDILDDIEKLVEEFNIQKIELELQQEELTRSNYELEYKNRRLDELFEHAPVGYFILDSNGKIIELNATAALLLQKTKKQIIKDSFTRFVHPSSQDHFYFYWQKLIDKKTSGNLEIALSTGKDHPEYFLLNSQPYLDKDRQEWFVRVSATDVTELKEAEALRDSERRYRLLFKNMTNGLLVLKPVFKKGELVDFRFFRANAAFEQITGHNPRKMEGAPFIHIFPDNGNEIFPILYQTIHLNKNQKLENFPLTKDSYVNVFSFIPETGYVALIIEDVTAQMLSEKEKQKSEELLRTIFKILPVGVTITDGEGHIIDCNPASELLLGLKKESHLVRNVAASDWEIIRTDLSKMPANEFASVKALKENHIVDNVEMGIVKNRSDITWINVSAAPIPLPDMGVAVVYSDITERVQAQEETEEKFKNIIQNSTDAIIIVNQSGNIIEWNKGCELIFGFKRKMALGQKIWNFMQKIVISDEPSPEKSLYSRENIQEALKTGENKWFRRINETAIQGSDKKFKTLQSVAFPVKSANGYLLGVVARDITESKETERMLKIAKEKAEEASQVKSQFLANISHEIRTPLNAIMGFTQILKEFQVTDTRFKSHLSGIQKSSKALMALINDILDLSRIEAGKMALNPTSFNIASLVEDVKQIFSLKAEQKGLDLNIVIGTGVPKVIFLDEQRLRQILFNLVGNAVKFTQKGGIRIEVEGIAKTTPKNTVDLIIRVADTGPGIYDSDVEAIFDPFYQKQTHETAKLEGTGLGLAISRRFAEMMKGKLTVDSTSKMGTVFVVNLPSVPIMEKISVTNRNVGSDDASTELSVNAHKELSILVLKELEEKTGSVSLAHEFMKNQIWSEYDKIADILGFDEVISFSELLLQIANAENLRYLKEFSLRLNREATSFNVIEINRMLSSFETIRQK